MQLPVSSKIQAKKVKILYFEAQFHCPLICEVYKSTCETSQELNIEHAIIVHKPLHVYSGAATCLS